MKGYAALFGPSPSGGANLGDRPVIGFAGPGEPGARCIDRKRKAKDRKRRKLARKQKQR